MFQDIMKDSWVYQEIVQESEERGEERGLIRGREEGHEAALQSQRQTVLDIVSHRFPSLRQLASQQVARMADLDALRLLIVNLSIRDREEDARKLLMDAARD